jgi:Trk K+ transport system NAD-binding subunit
MDRPIILCGMGRVGTRVLEFLQTAGLPVVVVDTACSPGDTRLKGVRLVPGDCRRPEVLEEAGIRQARGVLILTGDDLLNISSTLMVRALNPDVRIVLRMFNQNLIGRLGHAVKNVFALSTSLLTAPILAMTALTGQGLGTFRVEGRTDGRRQVAEITIGHGSELRGRTIGSVTVQRDALPVAYLPAGEKPRYLLDVDQEARLQEGDRLIVCGEPRRVSTLLATASEEEDITLRWAGWVRRSARVAGRTLRHMDKAVLACTLVLITVVVASTIVLRVGVWDYTTAHALLRAVSIMATVGDMHQEELKYDWVKIYVSILRIVGAVLWAAFTAIVTRYLVQARLGGALELRRIPDGGHVVVCGLSPIGFRTVEELVGLGERVVVIEMDPDNRFVATARRLGAAVILGDATVAEVLRQAHAAKARAVVAAMHNDLVNLEVALLVREDNDRQRVVLLLSDTQLASMLRDATNIRLAVSVPALAAPAFLAGLFGDRVASVFLVRERLLAVIDLLVQEQDACFVNQSVRAVAVDYRLLPVSVVPAQGQPPSQPLNAVLSAGDRLVGIIALCDLERLLRRQPAPIGYAVDVTAFPLPTRGWLAGLVRTLRGVTQEEAEAMLASVPFRLQNHLTRGQAEDLFARLLRERVTAKVTAVAEDEGT